MQDVEVKVQPKQRQFNGPLWFVILFICCQVGLLFLGSTPLRLPLRVATFSVSLAMLFIPGGRYRHPAAKLVPLVLFCLIANLFMPEQPSTIAAVAQGTLYLATLAPLFWVSGRPLTIKDFRWIILLLWIYNMASAGVGILQVYFPGEFQSQLSSVIQEKGSAYLGSLQITLANGSRTLRPMGLTDSPGGAASGGLNAILFGIGLFYAERNGLLRSLAVAGMIGGLFVIFLSHVRVSLVLSIVAFVSIAFVFARRGNTSRATSLLLIGFAVVIIGVLWAFAVGGDDTISRFATLTDNNPTDVYNQNRGYFLQDAFNVQIWKYPFGAGAGRWGMISYYFGDAGSSLWAEIMWSAWIYDGGIPLVLFYTTMIVIAFYSALKIGESSSSDWLSIWGAVIVAYNVAVFAATFDAPVFGTQSGVEFWFLNACLFNVWSVQRKAASARRLSQEELEADLQQIESEPEDMSFRPVAY